MKPSLINIKRSHVFHLVYLSLFNVAKTHIEHCVFVFVSCMQHSTFITASCIPSCHQRYPVNMTNILFLLGHVQWIDCILPVLYLLIASMQMTHLFLGKCNKGARFMMDGRWDKKKRFGVF